MKKISVVIPVYNVEKYLSDCLTSVINQTYKNLEIIVVNDGSTDNSSNIIKEFQQKDSRIILIEQENQGLGAARNTGIMHASGEYLYFLDSDDWLDLTCLEKMYKKIIENDSDICIMGTNNFIEKYNCVRQTNYYNAMYFNLDGKQFFSRFEVFLKLYKRSYFEKYLEKFLEKIWFEDVLVSVKGYFTTSKIVILRENLHYYRRRNGSIMNNSKNNIKVFDIFLVIKSVEDFLTKNNFIEEYKQDFIEFVLTQFAFYQKRISNKEIRKKFNNEIKDYLTYLDINNYIESNQRLKDIYDEIFPSLSSYIFSFKRVKGIAENHIIIKIMGIKCKIKILKNVFKKNQIRLENSVDNNVPSIEGTPKYETKQFLSNNKCSHIKNAIEKLNNFYFLPNQGNSGDIVIAFSEFQYFDSNNYNYKPVDVFEAMKLQKEFNLVYGGGGLWNALYRPYYQNILKVFKSPKLNQCVILPSSFYDCDEVIDLFDERFVVFCREKQSYDYCTKLNSRAKFILSDDMVINANFEYFKQDLVDKKLLSSKHKFIKNKIAKIDKFYSKVTKQVIKDMAKYSSFEVGYLLRSDYESILNKSDVSLINIDPSAYACGYACDNALNTLLAKIFLTTISQFDIVVTDRLHIGICACKLGKKTLLLDNSYKKLSNVYQQSLQNYPNVKVVTLDNLDEEILEAKKNLVQTKKLPLDEIIKISKNFRIYYANIKNDYGCEKKFWSDYQ